MTKINSLLFFTLCPMLFFGQSILGKWKTIDDRNGLTKAIVNIYEKDGLLYGKIETILEKGKEDARCIKCKGDKKDKPVIGMVIIDGFKKNNKGEYKGDTLFDPEQGMTFRGKIWLDPDNPDKLKVRGYLAFLYRTQTWVRYNS
ncbi:DUF2147 domain-containing protein [Croceivirga thetidis]|uniref:DUF2147 domain-containing protein n=1 Tax=Croceivirga thetidis TaxID=2721623 RepID=A0ABX1GRN6_9FLAO|nr:DUF2147 domain-containing protein [Croceivirga thetidis]NKI32603.1 DUF2147 domain-containing protein [Croceivirga thetidis]